MPQYRIDRVYYNAGEHLAAGMRPRHRRLGQSKSGRRISIAGVISCLCFVLAVSIFLFMFLSEDHSDIKNSNAEDYDFTSDFLANVTRITPSVVKVGCDSRYRYGDDRRRDEGYRESGKGQVPSRGNNPIKESNGNTNTHIHRRGLYNEAGVDELKMYGEEYEASLKKALITGGGREVSNDINSDREHDESQIAWHDAHVDDYDGNRHEKAVNSDLPISHSEGGGNIVLKARNSLVTLDEGLSEGGSSKFDSPDNTSGKRSRAAGANGQSMTKSDKQSKKHGRHRSHCEMKLLNSTAQLVEPYESRKFARFSLSYTEKETKADRSANLEPRFAGHQSLREREDSFKARDQKINCGFVKGPEVYSSTGFDLAEDDQRYMSRCHIAVISCIFGNSDRLRSPFVKAISRLSRKNVCFVMFMDETTLRTLSLEGQMPDRTGFIGLWRVVVVKNLPYTDTRRVGKIPKFLPHRLFPSARYSIWLDSKLRLQRDPLLMLGYFL